MCRADVEPQARDAVAKLLVDIAHALADEASVDLSSVRAHDAGAQIEAPGDELADTAETARRDLDRIFNAGGVAALVGNTYGAGRT
jgi:hypothetical protein